MFTKKTSLIIPTHNRPRFLGKTLKRLLGLNLLFSEIIVVDSSNDKYKNKTIWGKDVGGCAF